MSSFRTLIDRKSLQDRIRELADQIDRAHPDVPPVFLVVLDGARRFADALLDATRIDPDVHAVKARSYGASTTRNGDVEVSGFDGLDVRGRAVVVVEDIVDTGHTIDRLGVFLRDHGAARVEIATLLTKPSRREVEVELDYVGFEIPNEFVIGFGMDFDGKYRELDEVAVYED